MQCCPLCIWRAWGGGGPLRARDPPLAGPEYDPPHQGGSEAVLQKLALSVAQRCPHDSGGHQRMRAVELRAIRRRSWAERRPPRLGGSGAVTVWLAVRVARSATRQETVGTRQSSCTRSAVSRALSAARHMGARAGRSQGPRIAERALYRGRAGARRSGQPTCACARSAAGRALCAAQHISVGVERSPRDSPSAPHRARPTRERWARGGRGQPSCARSSAGHWQAL